MDISLEGWDIQTARSVDWMPWGTKGNARARILGSAEGYMVAYVEADAGYEGDPHMHAHPEFFYLVEGSVRNQGREMTAGDGYAASANSTHGDFTTETGATYVVIFKV